MVWTIKYTASATKQLKKVDKAVALRLLDYMDNRVALADDPRSLGRALVGPRLGDYWRYRVGDLRVICSIQDGQLCILVIQLGNRREIYK